MAYAALQHISPEIYLAEERNAAEKHEYFDGKVVAMAGASIAHNRIVSNLIRLAGNFLVGKDCEVFPGDLRVSIPSKTTYTYPDASIICGEPELTDEQKDTVKNPSVIFEVLSESTGGYDKETKFLYYQRIPSLKEYILIDSVQKAVIIYERKEDSQWNVSVSDGDDASLFIPSIGLQLSFEELYHNVVFSHTS